MDAAITLDAGEGDDHAHERAYFTARKGRRWYETGDRPQIERERLKAIEIERLSTKKGTK